MARASLESADWLAPSSTLIRAVSSLVLWLDGQPAYSDDAGTIVMPRQRAGATNLRKCFQATSPFHGSRAGTPRTSLIAIRLKACRGQRCAKSARANKKSRVMTPGRSHFFWAP